MAKGLFFTLHLSGSYIQVLILKASLHNDAGCSGRLKEAPLECVRNLLIVITTQYAKLWIPRHLTAEESTRMVPPHFTDSGQDRKWLAFLLAPVPWNRMRLVWRGQCYGGN